MASSIEGIEIESGGGNGQFFALPFVGVGDPVGVVSGSPMSAPAPSGGTFDLSPLAGLRDTDRFRDNLVGDIKSSYATFLSGSPVGRGGEYAVSSQRRFGFASIRDAAASYLRTVGLVFTPDPDPTLGNGDFFALPVPPDGTAQAQAQGQRTVIEQLLDVFPQLFGGAVYNPPLQSQATSYTPVSGGGQAGVAGGAGSRLGSWLLLGAVALAAYFVYKRVKGAQ